MKECCIKGVKHEGTPTGEIKDFGGTKSYVAKASSPSDVGIVYFADAFGYELPNNQLYVRRPVSRHIKEKLTRTSVSQTTLLVPATPQSFQTSSVAIQSQLMH
jgi:hypothetical protein